MRSSNKRSRSKSNRPKPLGNIINRVFDSSGPEGKVRGTPQQIIEKYLVLARDAQLSGDRVAAENFLQHAEHYTRMLSEAQRELVREAESRQQQQPQQHHNNNQPRRFEPRDDGDGGEAPVNAQGDVPDGDTVERQGDRSGDRSGDSGGRRNSRRDDRRDTPRPPRQPHRDQIDRDQIDPREAAVIADRAHAESDSMLVETPESRAATRPEARPETRIEPQIEPRPEPQAEPSPGASEASGAPGAEVKPRKPRSTTNRRAPRKPKPEGESTPDGNDTQRAAE